MIPSKKSAPDEPADFIGRVYIYLALAFAGILLSFVSIVISSFSDVSAAPLANPATIEPDPTAVPDDDYWPDTFKHFSWQKSEGVNVCLETGWHLADTDGHADCPDLTAPEDNEPAGLLVTLNSVSFTGDVRLHSGTNTTFVEKFHDQWTGGANEMTVGETICVGTVEACSSEGYSVNANSNWEGFSTNDGLNYVYDLFMWAQLGGASGGVDYTLQPIWYGPPSPCSDDYALMAEPFSADCFDATAEDGVEVSVAEGGRYGIEISGGPWSDGTDDRADVAYSWDGEEWGILNISSDDVLCSETSEDGDRIYYLEAQSNTLQLRVNDEAGAFDDNSGEMCYSIYGVVGSGETGCGQYYTLGDLVFSESWDPTFDWDGVPGEKAWPMLSEVYFENRDIYRILIPHTYQDGSDYNAEAEIQPTLGGSWINLADHPQTVCVEDHDEDPATPEGWMAYYFQSPEDFTTYRIRAADLDGSHDGAYDNNSGAFTVEVYGATYNPPVAGCASTFQRGNLIQNIMVPVDAKNGLQIPDQEIDFLDGVDEGGLIQDAAYMLEEPATWYGFNPGMPSTEWEISTDRVNWYDIDDYAQCIEPTDSSHNNYYFDAEVDYYYIRATDQDGDGDWTDQFGWVNLNLYYADDIRTTPDAEGSCPNLELGEAVLSSSVDATDSNGGLVADVFTPGHLYGIQITTPPWQEGDSSDQKSAQFKLANPSATWEDMEGHPEVICSELDGNDYPLIWFQAMDERYRIRADDLDDTFGNNSGWVNYTIYEASWIEDPIYPSCEGDYNPRLFGDFPGQENNGTIPAQWPNGIYLTDYHPRHGIYKITTSGGPWVDNVLVGPDIEAYDLEVSLANGATNTWQDLEDIAECIVPLPDGHHRYYLQIEEGFANIVRFRVNNQDSLWMDNTGEIQISVQYSAIGTDPDDPWDPHEDDPGIQFGGCDLICHRPGSSLNVPAWLEYFRCQLIRRLSFCPYHLEVLQSLREIFYYREPFGSLVELGQAFGLVRADVEAFEWHGDAGGEAPEVGYPDNFIFASPDGGGANIPIVGDDSPWGSGEIDILGEGDEFDTTCNNNMADALGERLAAPMCFAFNIIDSLGLSTWFQLFWDLVMIIAMGAYFQNRWLNPMSS